MKIVSHNVNGINAYKNNGKLDKLIELNADVYCLQEVKKSDIDAVKKILNGTELENYIMHYSFSGFKKGYAGVLTLIKPEIKFISEHHPEVNEMILENVSGYGEGRIVVTEFDKFYLVNVYVVNSGGGKGDDRMIWDSNFSDYLKSLNKPVIVCGDMNVCATVFDYWGNYLDAINTMPGLMAFEIEDICKLKGKNDLVDAFRHVHGDERKYSYVSMGTKDLSHGWRLDYFLVSDSLKNRIKNCDVHDNWQKYDHMPITLEINV